MADPEKSRRDEFLIDQDSFRRNALFLIDKMVALASGGVRALVDEILHSIFFLGRIHKPPFSPQNILRDVQMLHDLERQYPRPFVFCSSQIPKRSPFSCVLDMMVHLTGQGNETQIIDSVRALIRDPKLSQSQDLVSSTICVSHRTDGHNPVKYYGVSMSTPGRIPRQIMMAASCLSSWDGYVAGAVMTYFPTKKKNRDFDGTIKLPDRVRCQAFDLRENEDKPPCKSCGNLFGLTPCGNNESVYGNCAEVESLSNLFKNVADVKERARPTSTMYSDEKRDRVERVARAGLNNNLRELEFIWDHAFYTPQ